MVSTSCRRCGAPLPADAAGTGWRETPAQLELAAVREEVTRLQQQIATTRQGGPAAAYQDALRRCEVAKQRERRLAMQLGQAPVFSLNPHDRVRIWIVAGLGLLILLLLYLVLLTGVATLLWSGF